MSSSTTKDDLTIDVETLQQRLRAGDRLTVLDVRPAEERAEWSIPGSIHVDAYDALKRNDPDALAGIEIPDDRLIVTVCGAGKTSLVAAEQLRAGGSRAVSLEGGMKAWSIAYNTADVSLDSLAAEVVQLRRTGKGCLSYMVASDGEALVIDASLNAHVYIELAERRGWRISGVIDTHIHADHISRSQRLAERAGAVLYMPENERVSFEHQPIGDGDPISVGSLTLRALRTPGHTEESTCYVLGDEAIFTGDTLFTEGVGRPDLKVSGEAAMERARMLYGSLQRIFDSLSGRVVVLPGHASRPIAFDEEPIAGTLESIRLKSDVLSMSREEFSRTILNRIPPAPANYADIVSLNEVGRSDVEDMLGLEAGSNRCAVA